MVHFRLHFSTSQLYHYQKSLTRKQQKCGVTHDSSMHDKETAKMGVIQVCIHSNYESVAKVNNIRTWDVLEMCMATLAADKLKR